MGERVNWGLTQVKHQHMGQVETGPWFKVLIESLEQFERLYL